MPGPAGDPLAVREGRLGVGGVEEGDLRPLRLRLGEQELVPDRRMQGAAGEKDEAGVLEIGIDRRRSGIGCAEHPTPRRRAGRVAGGVVRDHVRRAKPQGQPVPVVQLDHDVAGEAEGADAMGGDQRAHPLGDLVEGLIPGDVLEPPRAPGADPLQRLAQTQRAVPGLRGGGAAAAHAALRVIRVLVAEQDEGTLAGPGVEPHESGEAAQRAAGEARRMAEVEAGAVQSLAIGNPGGEKLGGVGPALGEKSGRSPGGGQSADSRATADHRMTNP
ncbi:MAG: hypothetical protein RML45_09610 [Acetobacteraceae bacterium]|nr:hypothetical protein [Acetobacteraceae bacterium]